MKSLREPFFENRLFTQLRGLAGIAGRAAWAHHSALAEFDPDMPVKVTGTLKMAEWHVWFFVDVTEDDGTGLYRDGASRFAAPGHHTHEDRCHVEGARARDGSNHSSNGSKTAQPFWRRRQKNRPEDEWTEMRIRWTCLAVLLGGISHAQSPPRMADG